MSSDTPDPGGATAVVLDLPTPEQMRNLWAATAAVDGSIGYGADDVCAVEGDWLYHDGGGNWCRLFRYADGRALLIGSDHEYSETYYGAGAVYFEEPETDLLAGGEPWWADTLAWHDERVGPWVSFVYAFDGTSWRRAPYDLNDGFLGLGLPAAGEERCIELGADEGPDGTSDPASAAAMREVISAGPAVTEAQVRAVSTRMTDPGTGVAAARGFAGPGQH